jgi:hypothetical protein
MSKNSATKPIVPLPSVVGTSLTPLVDATWTQSKITKIDPFGNTTFTPTGTKSIVFKIPRDNFINTLNSFIQFDVVCDGVLLENAWSIFSQLIIKVGSVEVENLQNVGWYKSLEDVANVKESGERTGIQRYLQNIPTHYAKTTTTRFRIPLASPYGKDFLSKFSLIPAYKLDQITFELVLNGNLNEYTGDSATSVSVSNAVLELQYVDGVALREAYAKDLAFNFESFLWYHSSLPSGSTQINLNVPISCQNLRGVALIQRKSADVSSGAYGGAGSNGDSNVYPHKYTGSFETNYLNNFQAVLDGKVYPERPISNAGNNLEFVNHLSRFWSTGNSTLGCFYDSNTILNTKSKLYSAINFATDPNFVTGVSMNARSGSVILTGNVACSNNCDLDVLAKYDKFVRIGADGSINLTK